MSDFSDIFLSKYILKNKGFFAKLMQKKSLENVQNVQIYLTNNGLPLLLFYNLSLGFFTVESVNKRTAALASGQKCSF